MCRVVSPQPELGPVTCPLLLMFVKYGVTARTPPEPVSLMKTSGSFKIPSRLQIQTIKSVFHIPCSWIRKRLPHFRLHDSIKHWVNIEILLSSKHAWEDFSQTISKFSNSTSHESSQPVEDLPINTWHNHHLNPPTNISKLSIFSKHPQLLFT